MLLFCRGEIWYVSFILLNGKRFKQFFGIKDKRQVIEFYDKLKVEVWRVSKLGEMFDMIFEDVCVRWLEEKVYKKLLDDDKSWIGFWIQYFVGMQLKDIIEMKIYFVIQKMINWWYEENWKLMDEVCRKKGRQFLVFKFKLVVVVIKVIYFLFIKVFFWVVECEWKMFDKVLIIKIFQLKNKCICWFEFYEVKRLIDECLELLKLVVEFVFFIGLRWFNIINLEWQQIDM